MLIARASRKGITFITRWEGFVSCPYWDVSHWSIGYGTPATRGGKCITREQAWDRLRVWLNRHVIPEIPRRRRLKRQEVDALASLAYNNGSGVVSDPSYSTLARRLKSREGRSWRRRRRIYKDEIPKWCKDANGNLLLGLQKRRKAELNMALYGDYSGRP